ncbi:MAG: YggU family protein, partial [Candidatus Marithrix sp.]|nr:YggU family protein [Candidatus Marithrix sp.]
MTFYRWQSEDLILSVYVQPRSSQTYIVGIYNNKLKVKIKAAPVDGKANADIHKLFAKSFGVAKSKITILSGQTSRNKNILIQSPTKLPDYIKK